ncbi:18856_t:CDS:1, partial [Racocetra persica]
VPTLVALVMIHSMWAIFSHYNISGNKVSISVLQTDPELKPRGMFE